MVCIWAYKRSVKFKVQWCLICAPQEWDMELHMELLKLPLMETTQDLIASCEVFYAVWNAVVCMPQNGNTDKVKVDVLIHKQNPVPHARKTQKIWNKYPAKTCHAKLKVTCKINDIEGSQSSPFPVEITSDTNPQGTSPERSIWWATWWSGSIHHCNWPIPRWYACW